MSLSYLRLEGDFMWLPCNSSWYYTSECLYGKAYSYVYNQGGSLQEISSCFCLKSTNKLKHKWSDGYKDVGDGNNTQVEGVNVNSL